MCEKGNSFVYRGIIDGIPVRVRSRRGYLQRNRNHGDYDSSDKGNNNGHNKSKNYNKTRSAKHDKSRSDNRGGADDGADDGTD